MFVQWGFNNVREGMGVAVGLGGACDEKYGTGLVDFIPGTRFSAKEHRASTAHTRHTAHAWDGRGADIQGPL